MRTQLICHPGTPAKAVRAVWAEVALSFEDGFSLRFGVEGTLSAGQFQRVLFARLLLQDADLILLDEPFNAIDSKTTAELLALVADWHARQRTVIAVLHDHSQVHQHFPQTLLLARGVVAWGETSDVLTPHHLAQARLLGESWDDHLHAA